MGTLHAIFLLISLSLPASLTQCTTEKALPFFRRSVYEFSTELVSRVAQESENHFITSGLSPWTLISAISLGASDTTLEEIKEVLRLHPHQCFNRKFFDVVQQIAHTSDYTTLERSSTVFVDNRLPLNDEFVNRVRDTKISSVESVTVEDLNVFAATINDYVRRATHGTVDDIVEASDLEQVYLVLIDALYFKGIWQQPFSSEDTEVSAFYNEIGAQIGDVNLMFGQFEVNYTTVRQIGATILELPYGNGRFSMLFILPDQGHTISSVLDRLNQVTLSSIFILFQQGGTKQVMVQIPRFKINSDLDNMKEWLADMGLRSMFDANRASFPDISDYNLFVSNFVQKATIEVNEEGTEASVATGAFFQGRSLPMQPVQFTANKPFLFTIVDKHLELPVFIGAYSKPTVY